jgi:hypothetical protein
VILRTAAIAVWLALGGAVVFGFWWLFLNTSEADVLRLILSGLSLVLAVVTAGVVLNTAIMIAAGGGLTLSARVAIRRLHWFLIGAALVAGAVWATRAVDALVAQRYGEINAWFIATMDWTETQPLFDALRYSSIWLRWVFVPVAACAFVAALVRGLGPRVAMRALTRAWHWKTLLGATAAFLVLMAWPWRAAFWVSQPIGPAWTEPLMAALRLSLIAAAASLGAAIFVTAASRAVDRT